MSESEYDAFLRQMRSNLERRERYAFVLHLEALAMNAKRRKKMADILSEYDPFLRTYCLGGAIIANNRLAAAFVTAVRWLAPAPHPERVFSDVPAAYAFAQELLAVAGIAVPAAPASAGVNQAALRG
jgi:hypothetical protein